jgi:IS5 family transposase
MRETRNAQASIFDRYAKREIGNELAMMSEILDNCAGLIDWVEADLVENGARQTGRAGLPVESVLRCAVLKQARQLSYKELAFYLEDSGSFRSFARLPQGLLPRKSALQDNIRRIRPETWERINRALIEQVLIGEVESNDQVRIDSTVVQTNIHEPTDSRLLCDGIRVLTRFMVKARKKLDIPGIRFFDRRKLARSLARQIFYTRGMAKKKPLYEDLLSHAEQVMEDSYEALWRVDLYRSLGPEYRQWVDQVKHYRRLRASHRHYCKGWSRRPVRSQAQPDDG